MTYPNAASGIKKLHIAEILILIGTFIDNLFYVASNIVDMNNFVHSVSKAVLILIAVILLIGDILVVGGDVLNIVGLNKASKDAKLFRLPLFLSVAMIVGQIAIRVAFYDQEAVLATEWIEFAEDVIELIQMICVIVVCRRLARNLGGDKLIDASRRMMILVYVIIGVSVVINVAAFFSEAIILIASVAAGIFEFVILFAYLRYVDKAIEFLKEN